MDSLHDKLKNKEDRIQQLIDLLQRTDAELQELAGGELDAVVTKDRGAFLLREAQLKLSQSEAIHRESAVRQAAILNALPAHVALLDSAGRIVSVNNAWREFALQNDYPSAALGDSYLDVCDAAAASGDQDAELAGLGIQAVLGGSSGQFILDYPCHSPAERRWFRLMVAPLQSGGGSGAVVMHINTTEATLAQHRLFRHQSMLSSAVRIAGLGSWDYDLASGRLEWSKETLRIFGLSEDEWGGTFSHFLALLHPEDRPAMEQMDRSAHQGDGEIEIEYRILRPDGQERLVFDRGETLFDPSGNPVRRAGMVLDITERRQAERVLREAEERFRHVSENIAEVIWITDPAKNRMLFISPRYEKIWGRSCQSLYDSPESWLEAIHPDDRERIRQALPRQAEGRYDETYRIQQPNGAIRWIQDRAYPVRDDNGDVFRLVGMAEDISDRMRHDQVTEALFHLGQQLATVTSAHEAGETIARVADDLFSWDALTLDHYNKETGLMTAVLTKDTVEGRRTDCPRAAGESPPSRRAREVLENGAKLILRGEDAPPVLPENMIGDRSRTSASIMLVPVRDGADNIGVLSIQSYRRNAYSSRDLDALQLLGDYCGGALNRIRSESRRRALESKFQRLADSNILGISFWEKEGRIADANDAFLGMVRYSRADLRAGKIDWRQLTPPEYAALDDQALRQLEASGKCDPYEKEYFRSDGTRVPILLGAAMLNDGDGRGICFIIDLTDRRNAEASMRESEERFRLLSKATNDAIWDWDLASNSLWWNEGFEALFGFSREEIEPALESWTNRLHPDDREAVLQSLDRAISEGQTAWSAEYRFQRSDQSLAWVLDRGHVIRDSSGQARRMIGGMTDITERRKYEEQLAEQAALLDSAREAILVKDLQDRIIYWNKGAERTFGWSREEALGKETLSLIYRDSSDLRTAVRMLLNSGEWQGEVSARTQAGKDLHVDVRWTLLRDSRGQPKSILEISSDITEKKRLEAQFLRAQRLESIGTLAGGIAHDLNNVLAPILMSLELLKMDEADPGRLQMLDTIQGSAQRGADLVRQVLAFARGFSGAKFLINPAHIVREILKITRETFPKNISIAVEADPEPWNIVADATQVHQVLMNLCVNARDALSFGGQITIQLRNIVIDETYAGMNRDLKPGPYLELSVEDNGAGMTPEVQERIFDPFFTTKEVGKGTGLGLATVLTIVKDHGGAIHVYSELNRGTTFKVYLPATTDESAVEALSDRQSPLPRGRGETILVVDDEDGIRDIAKRCLDRYGYKTLLAGNGAEAIAVYVKHSNQISAVLTDMAMPIMDGPSMITALRLLAPELKIVGSSGILSNEGMSKAIGAGVEYFVPKPYTAETMLRTLHQVLHQPPKASKTDADF